MIKNKGLYSNRFFIGLLIAFSLFQFAFYKVMIEAGDNVAHMIFVRSILTSNPAGQYYHHLRAYPLYHITVRLITFLCLGDYNVAGICVLTASNIAAVLVARIILLGMSKENSVLKRYIIDVISVAYLLFEPIASRLTEGRVYARQCGPNPWHNPTITFVRPIGLLAFLFFVITIKNMKEKIIVNDYRKYLIGFSVMSALSVLAKPSFMMVFLPAMGLYTLFYWMNDIKGRFGDAMRLLAAVMPTIIILLLQVVFFQFFNDVTAGEVKFMLGGFSEFKLDECVKVCLATFPVPLISMALFGKESFKTEEAKIAYIALAIGIVEMFMFTNGPSGDFSWGYDLAVGLSTIVVLEYSISVSKKTSIWRAMLLASIFAWQTKIGVNYVVAVYEKGGFGWF